MDWSIGAGADTITSYGYYVIGDPFVYLGVFFPENLREFSFHLLIFLRIWCVGISYIFFTRKFKISHQAGLLGAVMYTFSFFVIYNVKRHPFFIMPLILYPILCLGVEKILKKESGIIFSIVVAISSMVNFYFFYKLTILTFIYGSVRYLTLYGFKNIKHLFLTLCQCIIYYLIGLFIGSILFLPMVGGFLDASRHTGEITLNLIHYHISYYIVLIHNAFVPYSYLWSVGGLSIFSLFTIIFFMRTKKEKNFAAIISLLLGVFLLIPFFGSFMNGMSGPYNRFSFVIPFFIAIGSGQLLDARKKDLKIAKYLLIIFTLIYLIAAILENMYTFYLTPIIIGWAMWLLFSYEIKFSLFSNKISTIFIVLVMINMATNAMNLYYSYGNNSISDTVELNTSISKYKDLYGGLQKDLPKDEWYRVGVTSQDKEIRNQFIYHDLKGLSTYLSITNKYISNFAKEMDFSTYQIIQPLRNGLDDRRLMNYFLNVKYILTKKENENYLPVGYRVIKESTSNSNYILAKTEYSFPFAYTVDKIMFREHFSKLNPLEKEYILTQGAVLEDSISIPTKSFEKGLNSHFNRVEYSIKDNDLDTKKINGVNLI
ncbi:hypothetical protein GCM10007425_31430 [Lysinibacillus alkalisoli]|uniref:Uncharacterized protein n=1 Tax=Lysinibacillus alkalisoli TaxID=1911548 RepID=A0A917GAV8_9BACI|nr:YfhO family protein [Lysinibacillus alkalisoli]GGG34445.1 hypothetical protein GCM10007425_31430 [Lysinibacillus alkalisoli]